MSLQAHTVGFGYNITITTNVTDNGSGVNLVKVRINQPGGTSTNNTMTHISGNMYRYIYTTTWLVGQYNYSIYAQDNENNTNTSTGYHFHVSADATISICTTEYSYTGSQYINLTDPPNQDNQSNYIINGDSVSWENQYAALAVTPHTSTDIVTHTQYANLTWKQPDNTIDVAFRFNIPPTNPNIWLWQNISHTVTIPDYGAITADYTLSNITGYQLLTVPPTMVDYGDVPSLHYATVTINPNQSLTIGFDTYQWLNTEHTACKFTYTYTGQVGSHTEERYYYDWNSINDRFSHVVFNNQHYYIIRNVTVKQGKTYQLKWQYDMPPNTQGKWELLAKFSSDTIPQALASGRYVILDPWWNSNWQYRKLITIDHTKVSSSLTNFPILISITDNDLKAHAKSNGYDIAFIKYSDNTTQFKHEIENYSVATGKLTAWVNVTSISSSVDTKFWMYYGNPSSGNQQNRKATWDSNYLAVYHMNNATGGCLDSTYTHNATAPVAPDYLQTGKIGYCENFTKASGEYLLLSNSNDLDGLSAITVEVWMKQKTNVNDGVVSKSSGSTYGTQNWQMMYVASDGGYFRMSHASPSNQEENAKGTITSCGAYVGTWKHVVGTWTAGQRLRIYVNGTNRTQSTNTFTGMLDTTSDDRIADRAGVASYTFNGMIDEVRISKVQRNASWIATEFKNQNSSSTFMTFGSEQNITQSKINNTGSTDIKGYLLIQVQYNNAGTWVVDKDTINETTPRTITSGNHLGLDTIFNGHVRASDLSHGTGTYRVYTAFRDPNGTILVTSSGVELKAYRVFTKT
jgi:hypothetical protein